MFRDDSDEVWWEVSTLDPETHQPVSGYTSRYNFYPKDSERREDQYPWFLGKINKNRKIRKIKVREKKVGKKRGRKKKGWTGKG